MHDRVCFQELFVSNRQPAVSDSAVIEANDVYHYFYPLPLYTCAADCSVCIKISSALDLHFIRHTSWDSSRHVLARCESLSGILYGLWCSISDLWIFHLPKHLNTWLQIHVLIMISEHSNRLMSRRLSENCTRKSVQSTLTQQMPGFIGKSRQGWNQRIDLVADFNHCFTCKITAVAFVTEGGEGSRKPVSKFVRLHCFRPSITVGYTLECRVRAWLGVTQLPLSSPVLYWLTANERM